MAKLHLKKTSKRMPARRRYKIEKKVREHNRKLRKEAKKKQNKGGKQTIQIPNICPFKEELLEELHTLRKQKLNEKRERKEAKKEGKDVPSKGDSLAVKFGQAVNREVDKLEQKWKEDDDKDLYDEAVPTVDYNAHEKKDEKSMKVFKREFKKVVEAADVLLEVLDARDPLGTRSEEMEQHILEHADKRLVFVLNKADLVPVENLNQWLKYLRQFFPAIPFKASTQHQKKRLSQRKKWKFCETKTKVLGSPCVGSDLLMSLLNNYCRNKDIKTAITVGIVGFPNVGKSSIINSLKRNRACNVGATPGVTKNVQEIHLDKKIKLLDSPGVVYGSEESSCNSRAALRNALRVENMEDPISYATAILKRADKKQMTEKYWIADYSTPMEFFALMAKRFGMWKKGGIPNPVMAARKIINDWNRGKIQYFTVPPEEAVGTHVSAEIVQTMAKEFDLAAIDELEQGVIKSVKNLHPRGTIILKVDNISMDVDENPQEDKELPDGVTIQINNEKSKKKNKKHKNKENEKEKPQKQDFQLTLQGNQKLNNLNKLKMKKLKKEKARQARKASSLADTLETINLKE